MRILLLWATLLGVPVSFADEKDAETCIRTKIWDGYADKWAVRSATKALLKQGEYRVYVLTMYAGTEYRFQACSDKVCKNVGLILYDAAGNEVQRTSGEGREPEIRFKPAKTDAYYVAMYASQNTDPTKRAGVALATTYR